MLLNWLALLQSLLEQLNQFVESTRRKTQSTYSFRWGFRNLRGVFRPLGIRKRGKTYAKHDLMLGLLNKEGVRGHNRIVKDFIPGDCDLGLLSIWVLRFHDLP
jgi:hypothetical protein